MTRDAALEVLSRHRVDLTERFGVSSIALFGSTARNEANASSDVDVLVDFDPDAHVGMFGFVRLQQHLEALFGQRVDLVTADALRPEMRDRILAELVRAA